MAAEENFDSGFEKALQSLSHLGMSCKLRTEQTKAIYTLVSGGDTSYWFRKKPDLSITSSIRLKEILTGKSSSVIVVCLLKSIIQDQLAEAPSP